MTDNDWPEEPDDDISGQNELEALREVDKEVAARLAALEVLDPSQKRPMPRPNRVNYVEF
jgi:hypothetical protein